MGGVCRGNLAMASKLYLRAAEQGHAVAEYSLGVMYPTAEVLPTTMVRR